MAEMLALPVKSGCNDPFVKLSGNDRLRDAVNFDGRLLIAVEK
ncbi:hypothetical protein [Methylomonas albis]|nr:hypothetical protein [Methylomonas albis]CAD6879607.1 hypothetical protein [Methylomonas albis]